MIPEKENFIFELPESQTPKLVGKIISLKSSRFFDLRTYHFNYIDEWLATPTVFRIHLKQIEGLEEGIDKVFAFWWASLPGALGK